MGDFPDHSTVRIATSLPRVYDLYRTSLLNVKYYGYQLRLYRRISLSADILIVIGSTASGVSGWTLWTLGYGKTAWAIIAAIAALVAAIKPLLDLTGKIERYAKLYGGHNSNYLSLMDLVDRINRDRTFNEAMEREFRSIFEQYRELSKEDEPHQSRKLVHRFQEDVKQNIPAARLWIPKEECE